MLFHRKEFLNAGNDYLEEKTFHYLSGSLFDIIDEPENEVFERDRSADPTIRPDYSSSNFQSDGSSRISQDLSELTDQSQAQAKSRDKFGNLDETYGSTRFGAIFLDFYSSSSNLNKDLRNRNSNSNLEESKATAASSSDVTEPDVYSLYIIFYKISVNLSANFLHRLLKIYESYQSHIYTHPYSDYQAAEAANFYLLDTSDENINFGKLNAERQKIQIESLANKFEKCLPLQKNSFIFKEPRIKIHPFSHLPVGQTNQVVTYRKGKRIFTPQIFKVFSSRESSSRNSLVMVIF